MKKNIHLIFKKIAFLKKRSGPFVKLRSKRGGGQSHQFYSRWFSLIDLRFYDKHFEFLINKCSEEKAKDKHEKFTKKRNDLWHLFRWRRRKMLKKLRVCRSEPFIKDNFIS